MQQQKSLLHELVCYHCGEELPSKNFMIDDKHFCCVGCKSVYQILSANNMCSYYSYNVSPGQRLQSVSHFDYLDEPKIVSQLVNYQDAQKTIVTFYIPAMHCSSCIWLLEHLYKIDQSIYESRTDFIKKEVTISFKHQEITLRSVVEILSSIGYEPLISLQDVIKQNAKAVDRSLIKKIAIAGFAMGNVMLFSFPEYFGLNNLENQFQTLFGWLNLAFSIPVTFYCAKDYFISAYNSLKHKHINLDTPLALIIAVLFIRTSVSVIFNTGPGFADTLTGLVFLLLMGKWVKQRTYYHISFDRDYRSYFPIAITTLKDGKEHPVGVDELKIGDRLWIRNGELVPADSILMKGQGWVNMSFVTGETEPQAKVLGEIIYAGGKQEGEAIEVEVIKSPSQSYLTSLWNKDNYQARANYNFNDSVAKYFSIAVFIIAFSAFGYWIFMNDNTKAWSAFTAVIIVACPCVLALSTPFTLSAILSVFDKKGFYVKNTDAIEQMVKCNAIIFDKTGTLTSSENAIVNFCGELSIEDRRLLVSVLQHSSHPLSRQILKSINCDNFYPISKYEEILGKGIKALIGDKKIYVGSESILPFERLKVYQNGVHVMIDDSYKGYFVIEQKWRDGLAEMLFRLSSFFKFYILSGDTNKDEQTLVNIFPKSTDIRFKQSPTQKLDEVVRQQKAGYKVMMLGDGLNDAGALKQSNFGIAITDNINNFTPGCDAILKGSSINHLPDFYQLSKDGLKIIKISFAIAIAYNFIGLYYAIQGNLYPLVAAILMPISTITIISFTTLATRYFARKNKLL